MNPLNVFKGPDSLAQYFDPDNTPLVPLLELPDSLNPIRADGVRIFAKMLTALPAQNVKSLPALNMLRHRPDAREMSIVEASSGSTALSLGMTARVLWGHQDVQAYVTNKKTPESLRLLQFFGLKPVLYGGLAQQEPSDPKGVMNRLRNLERDNPHKICYPAQYDNDENWKSHARWTGPQIWQQLPEITVFCTTVGTGGCVTGTGVYLKSMKPSVKVVGVCNVFGDPTPGPRHFPGFESSSFPWRDTIDRFVSISSVDSYRQSLNLCRHGIIAGPSSGEALQGVITYIQEMKASGRLGELADPATGEVSCVFVCADLPYQYMDLYFRKLGQAEFPSIGNEELLSCDLDPYDERWFLAPGQAVSILTGEPGYKDDAASLSRLICHLPHAEESALEAQTPPRMTALTAGPAVSGSPGSSSSTVNSDTTSSTNSDGCSITSSPTLSASLFSLDRALDPCSVTTSCPSKAGGRTMTVVIDVRPAHTFAGSHITGSTNLPLAETKPDFFGNASLVRKRWHEIDELLGANRHLWDIYGCDGQRLTTQNKARIVMVCSDGDSSKMACSWLRARGREAFCLESGYDQLRGFVKSRL